MPRTADPALEEAGLSEEDVAASLGRVFGLMIEHAEGPAGDPIGWGRVVSAARDVFGGDEESEVQLKLPELSDFFRLAYGRGVDPDYQASPAATLRPDVRMGWEAITRHLLNVFALESKEARKLEMHEAQIVEFVKKRSATPKDT